MELDYKEGMKAFLEGAIITNTTSGYMKIYQSGQWFVESYKGSWTGYLITIKTINKWCKDNPDNIDLVIDKIIKDATRFYKKISTPKNIGTQRW